MMAANMGHIDCVKQLFDEVKLRCYKEYTALAYAISGNHVEIVRSLVQYESGITLDLGYTALVKAI